MRFLSVFDPQTTEFGLECLFPVLSDPFNDLLVNLLLVPASGLVIVAIVAVWVGWRVLRRLRSKNYATPNHLQLSTNDGSTSEFDQCEASSNRVTRPIMWGVNVLLFILWLFYFQICNKSLAAFNCLSGTFILFIIHTYIHLGSY